MLTRTHHINSKQLHELETCLRACKEVDGSTLPIYPHILTTYRPGPASLFYYDEQGALIGFLALFHFYPDAVEITLCVHPSHRRQGIAHELWQTMLSDLHVTRTQLKGLIISSPHPPHQSWLETHAFNFQYTEYDMNCDTSTPRSEDLTHLSIRRAHIDDIPLLCKLDHACFNPNRPNPVQRFESLLATSNVLIFIAFKDGQLIGQVHLIFEEDRVRLTDLAVTPKYQQQGHGQALLNYAFRQTHEAGQQRLTLIVAAKNQHALKLYQNAGFTIYNAVNYYKRAFSLDRF